LDSRAPNDNVNSNADMPIVADRPIHQLDAAVRVDIQAVSVERWASEVRQQSAELRAEARVD